MNPKMHLQIPCTEELLRWHKHSTSSPFDSPMCLLRQVYTSAKKQLLSYPINSNQNPLIKPLTSYYSTYQYKDQDAATYYKMLHLQLSFCQLCQDLPAKTTKLYNATWPKIQVQTKKLNHQNSNSSTTIINHHLHESLISSMQDVNVLKLSS